MTRWGPYVRQRLDDIASGKGRAEWEGEWPRPHAVSAAWAMAIETLPDDAPTPSVVPGDDGAVMLIWHKGGWLIEIEVDPEGSALVWMWDRSRDGDDHFEPLEEGRDRLRALLGELALL